MLATCRSIASKSHTAEDFTGFIQILKILHSRRHNLSKYVPQTGIIPSYSWLYRRGNSQNEPRYDGKERGKREVVAADVPGDLSRTDTQGTVPNGRHFSGFRSLTSPRLLLCLRGGHKSRCECSNTNPGEAAHRKFIRACPTHLQNFPRARVLYNDN